jgi:hypothetical protein
MLLLFSFVPVFHMDVMCEVLESRPRYYDHDTVWHDQELDLLRPRLRL